MFINKFFVRKLESFLFAPFKKRNWLYLWHYAKSYKLLYNIISNWPDDNIIVSFSMPFNNALFQRSQHLAIELSKCGFLYLYGEQKNVLTYKYSESLVISDFNLINNVCKKLGKKPYLLLTTTSPYNLKQVLKLKKLGYKVIYEFIDEMSDEIHDSTQGKIILNNLNLIEPVLCIATSKHLLNILKDKYPQGRFLLNPNAVNLQDFCNNSSEIPVDMQNVIKDNKPVVGYYGAIATWLNYELINTLTKNRPDYNFVFIGSDFKGLHLIEKLPNVFYLGEKKYKELIRYSSLFDCAIIPFKDGEIAKATSPVKLFEYMCAQIPVVCTKDMQECYGYDGVFIAKDNTDFINCVDSAIAISKDENIKIKLLEYAQQNTWAQRAQDIKQELCNELSAN